MDVLGYLMFGIGLVAIYSPKWVGEWLARVRGAYEGERERQKRGD